MSARRSAYFADVVIVSGSELIFDALHSSNRRFTEKPIQQEPFLVLVDEVDQFLLDESQTPHILSGETGKRFAAFVEDAWVRQVDIWVESIFRTNTLITTLPNGDWQLTTAGRIFLRSLIDEDNIRHWFDLELFLKDKFFPLQLLIETLLLLPMFSEQLDKQTRNIFQDYVDNCQNRILSIKNDRFKVSLRALLGRLNFIDFVPSGRYLKEFIDLLMTELKAFRFTDEDLQFIQGLSRRQVLGVLLRLVHRRFFVNALEALFNEIASKSESERVKRALTPQLIDGLTILIHPVGHGRNSRTQSPATWFLNELLPFGMNFVRGGFLLLAEKEGRGIHQDLTLIGRLLSLVGKLPQINFSHYTELRELIEEFSLLGALLQNFLYIPQSGKLTLAGQRVAAFLEYHCTRFGMAENYHQGGIIELIQKSLFAYCGKQEKID